jgi:all-trans-8'-apo-beta-carotenal 15,15'-oxygenase
VGVLLKLNTQTKEYSSWACLPHQFIGETNFVPRKGAPANAAEDDGYLMTLLFDGKEDKSSLLIFDAKDIQQGAIDATNAHL